MRKSTKVVIGFAVAGFVLPMLFLTFYAVAGHFNEYPSMTPFFYVCPSSIIKMAIDMDGPLPLLEGMVVWLMICLSNAVLYAAPMIAIGAIYRVIRPNAQPDGRWLQ